MDVEKNRRRMIMFSSSVRRIEEMTGMECSEVIKAIAKCELECPGAGVNYLLSETQQLRVALDDNWHTNMNTLVESINNATAEVSLKLQIAKGKIPDCYKGSLPELPHPFVRNKLDVFPRENPGTYLK